MLKAAFWICVLVIAMPFLTGNSTSMPQDYDPEPVKLGEVASMVRTTASDVMRLCEREPEACDTGQRIMWNARLAAGELAGRAQAWVNQATESRSAEDGESEELDG
jgi:hypothetical protein